MPINILYFQCFAINIIQILYKNYIIKIKALHFVLYKMANKVAIDKVLKV